MPMAEAGPRAAKIRWSDEERAMVLREAATVALKHPKLSPLQLARMGQSVLPEWRHREVMSVTTDNWAWFTGALESAIEMIREGRQAAEEAESIPADEPAPAEAVVDATLLAELEGSRADRAAAWEKLDARMARLEGALGQIAAALGQLAGTLGGGFALTPLGRGVAPITTPAAVLDAPGTGFAPVRLPPPAPVATTTIVPRLPHQKPARKPRVLVLSVGSGGTRDGIKLETKGHIEEIAFWDAPNLTKAGLDLSRWDYIVCTKDTPLPWVETAKQSKWRDKIRAASGPARRIGQFIRDLPEVTA
jgi:hypothetical protein